MSLRRRVAGAGLATPARTLRDLEGPAAGDRDAADAALPDTGATSRSTGPSAQAALLADLPPQVSLRSHMTPGRSLLRGSSALRHRTPAPLSVVSAALPAGVVGVDQAEPSSALVPSTVAPTASTATTALSTAAGPLARFVTVYGFPPELSAPALHPFYRCGTVLHREPGVGNWAVIEYDSPTSAQLALARHGTIVALPVALPVGGVGGVGLGAGPSVARAMIGVKLTDPGEIPSSMLHRVTADGQPLSATQSQPFLADSAVLPPSSSTSVFATAPVLPSSAFAAGASGLAGAASFRPRASFCTRLLRWVLPWAAPT